MIERETKFLFVVAIDSHTKPDTADIGTAYTCDIRPCTCSTVIFALSRVILASGDSSCKSGHQCVNITDDEQIMHEQILDCMPSEHVIRSYLRLHFLMRR